MATDYIVSDDAQRIERARMGDTAAFEALLRQYERPLYGFIYRLMGNNADDAADLLQETFIKVYRALPRIPPEVNFPAWLYRVARNCCLDEMRRRRRAHWTVWDGAQGVPERTRPGIPTPSRWCSIAREIASVAAVLARMSPRNREALILRECEGMTARRSARSSASPARR